MDASPDTHGGGLERCEIRRWRGYATSSFYAVTSDGDVVAESASFRWRKSASPPGGADARAAYEAVVAAVSADGWTFADGPDAEWYETRFTRPSRAPVIPAVAEPVEPVPIAPPPVPPPEPPARTAPSSSPPPEPVPPPVPTLSVPGRSRAAGPRLAAVGGAAALIAAGAAVLPLTLRGGTRAPTLARTVVKHQTAARHPVTSTRTTVATAAVADRTELVDLRIVAGTRGSWMEIRRRSASGPVLYEGTLEPGRQLHLRGSRLWGLFGAAGNVSISDNGRRIELSGTQKKLFVP